MVNLSNFQGWGANGTGVAINDPGNGAGGSGGSVQGTITNPSIAGATWDYVVGEGGNGTSYATPSPEVGASGGYGGGGSGSTFR